MKMRNYILRLVSVFFLVLVLVGCGIATFIYIKSSFFDIQQGTESITAKYDVLEHEENLSLIDNGNGPGLMLCYVVTSRAQPPAFNSSFQSKYQRNNFGISISTADIVSYTSDSLTYNLYQFSDSNGTLFKAPAYFAVADDPTVPTMQFRLDLVTATDNPNNKSLNFTLESGSYSLKGNLELMRFSGDSFITNISDANQLPDYTIAEGEGTLYLHVYAAMCITSNNILWSDLQSLGSFQLN